MIRVLVVEDHKRTRARLQALLGTVDVQVVGVAADGAEAIAVASRTHPPISGSVWPTGPRLPAGRAATAWPTMTANRSRR
jgi:hypothetical protein